jgi:hypothetical protein
MIRKRNDAVKSGRGVDGNLGENFTKQYRTNPWDSNPAGDYLSPQGAGKYQSDSAYFLNNKLPYERTEESYDVWDAVESQSGDGGNITYGAGNGVGRKVRSRGQP